MDNIEYEKDIPKKSRLINCNCFYTKKNPREIAARFEIATNILYNKLSKIEFQSLLACNYKTPYVNNGVVIEDIACTSFPSDNMSIINCSLKINDDCSVKVDISIKQYLTKNGNVNQAEWIVMLNKVSGSFRAFETVINNVLPTQPILEIMERGLDVSPDRRTCVISAF